MGCSVESRPFAKVYDTNKCGNKYFYQIIEVYTSNIFSNISKGRDKAEIRLRTANKDGVPQTYADLDELKEWADSRYVSAHESIWTLFMENIWLSFQFPQSDGP